MATEIAVLDLEGKESGSFELPASLFDAPTNIPLIHQVVVAQLAAARQGTHKTKNRGEVSGSGAKPFKQKGTGRARQGSIRMPQHKGGGIVHGPVPRDYSQRTPKRMIAAALLGALSDRARAGRVFAVEGFVQDDAPATRFANELLGKVSAGGNVLVVLTREDELGYLSVRNLPFVQSLVWDQLNAYDVLRSDDVVFTKDALDAFVSAKGESVVVSDTAPKATKADKAAAPKAAKAEKAAAPKAEKAAKAPKADKAAATIQPLAAVAETAEVEEGEFGADSAAPLADGSAPEGFDIKGNKDSMKFHRPDGRWYDNTIAEVWFRTAEAAEAAGFTEAGTSTNTKEK